MTKTKFEREIETLRADMFRHLLDSYSCVSRFHKSKEFKDSYKILKKVAKLRGFKIN